MDPKNQENSIEVSVLVDDAHASDLRKVASDLTDKGFVLKESLEAIGVLTGSIPAHARQSLATVPGVAKVEDERTDYRTQ